MNKKVYIITYHDEYSNGECYSGVSYVFDSLEKARKMLEEIKQDEIAEYKENGYDITNDIKLENDTLTKDSGDFSEYKIIESQVK